MPFCITANREGQELYREEKPKRWVPKDGWMRGYDGNFYKYLGSPYCISSVEAVEAIKRKEQEAQEAKEQEEAKANEPPIIPVQYETGYNTETNIHWLVGKTKPTYSEIFRSIDWKTQTRSGEKITFEKVFLKEPIFKIAFISGIKYFHKMELDYKEQLIRLWDKHSPKNPPDYIIAEGLGSRIE
jgi:hypothetical protein